MDGSENGNRPLYEDAFKQYIHEVGFFPTGADFSPEEKDLIERLATDGDIESRRELIVTSLRYATKIARRYYFPGKMAGMDPIDVIQEANCGLIQAAITFRSGQSRFLTYAHHRIEGQVKDAIRKNSTGKGVSRKTEQLYRRITEVTVALFEVFGRPPTTEEIANHMQVSVDELMEATRVMALITQGDLPLNAKVIIRGTDRDIEELVEDIHATDPEEASVRRENQHELREVINEILKPRERFLVGYYFNLVDDKRTYSLKELAELIGISESRASQLLRRSLQKLGAHPKIAEWHAKLPALDPKIQTTLTVFEMARRQDESERRRIYNDWRERTVLFEAVKV